MEHELSVEKEKPVKVIKGNRIVDLQYILDWALPLQAKHSRVCTQGTVYSIREDNRGTGLVSNITLACNTCDQRYVYSTENPTVTHSKINTGAVWGTLSSGSSYGHLLELLSVLDIPPLPYRLFSSIEDQLTDVWNNELLEDMLSAGEEEKQLAINKGQVDGDGIPWVTVYLDGGWSKRSYGHSYNAASGVGVIIGKETGKILFLGVRNKYCCICARAVNKGATVKSHVCFKNWKGSSAAMESDIMVEGFKHSEQIHGLRYLKFIADGDASVYARLKEKVSYGRSIQKIECRNHMLKNVTKALYGLKNDTSINKEGRKLLTQQKIKEIEKFIQRIIYENAGNRDVDNLYDDIRNTILHVYGDHSNCKHYLCLKVGDNVDSEVTKLKFTAMYNHIEGALDTLLKKANRLVDNETNNRAEVYMQIVARFNSGKRLNLIQRGSFQRRATLSGLRYNRGVDWQYKPWKKFVEESPGSNFKTYLLNESNSAERRKFKRKLVDGRDECFQRKKKSCGNTLHNTEYGPKAEDAEPEPIEVEIQSKRLLEKLQVSPAEQAEIAKTSIGQFGNPLYEMERKDRLTASNFGAVIKRKMWTPCHNLVKTILYPKAFFSPAIEFGKRREKVAIEIFSKQYDVEVQPAGLYVDIDHGFLGASPDGLIGNTHLVEVKCLYSVHKSGKTLEEAANSNPSLCLAVVEGKLQLKREHNYFYQIQGQLNICQREACYFIVYINDDQPLHVEEIKIDKELWKNEMLPKLINFYKNCILQEMVRGNIPRNKRCQDPQYILDAIEERHTRTLFKELKKIESAYNF